MVFDFFQNVFFFLNILYFNPTCVIKLCEIPMKHNYWISLLEHWLLFLFTHTQINLFGRGTLCCSNQHLAEFCVLACCPPLHVLPNSLLPFTSLHCFNKNATSSNQYIKRQNIWKTRFCVVLTRVYKAIRVSLLSKTF